MTSIAFITDVHADVHALRDALTQAERFGCQQIVCAGDVVDHGLFPQETIDLLLAAKVLCIRGNHDRWAIGHGRPGGDDAWDESEPRDWSGFDLSPQAVRYLAQRSPSWRATVAGTRLVVCHGTPNSDREGIDPDRLTAAAVQRWLEAAGADVLVVGHTHRPFVAQVPEVGMIVNPGALLRSPAHPERVFAPGTFGVLTLPERHFQVRRAADGAELDIPRRTLAP